MPEAVQRQAIMACQAERGINIPEAVNVLRISQTSVAVSVVNGPGLSLTQARAINQCAQAKLLNNPASVVAEPSCSKSGGYEHTVAIVRHPHDHDPNHALH